MPMLSLKDRPPTNPKELRSFLGMVNWFCRFVPCLSDRAKPLNNLLKKDVSWIWTQDHQLSMESILDVLVAAPVLQPFSPEFPLRVTTDASAARYGVMISHYDLETKRDVGVICCVSKTLTPSQLNYSAVTAELSAVVWALTVAFRDYINPDSLYTP